MKPPAVDQNVLRRVFNLDAELLETAYRGETVRPFQKVGHFGRSVCEGAEHDGAVGDGLIAGNGNFSGQAVAFF